MSILKNQQNTHLKSQEKSGRNLPPAGSVICENKYNSDIICENKYNSDIIKVNFSEQSDIFAQVRFWGNHARN